MTAWQMYWLLKLDDVVCLAFLIGGIGLFGAVLGSIFYVLSEEKAPWFGLKVGLVFVGVLVIGTFIPSTKQMAAIIVVPRLSQTIEKNEKLQALPNQLVDLASQWIEELKPEKKAEPE